MGVGGAAREEKRWAVVRDLYHMKQPGYDEEFGFYSKTSKTFFEESHVL